MILSYILIYSICLLSPYLNSYVLWKSNRYSAYLAPGPGAKRATPVAHANPASMRCSTLAAGKPELRTRRGAFMKKAALADITIGDRMKAGAHASPYS